MKKILKFGCGPIAYNDNFICSGGNKIGVINPETDEVCATLTGIKNISSLSMDEKYVYAKSTTGVYGMFDLETFSLIHKGSCRGRKDSAHDGTFFCVNDGVVLDALSLKDEIMYAVKYNFYKNDYEKIFLTNHMFTCFNRAYDKTKRKAYFLCIKKAIVKMPNIYCKFFVIDVDNLSIEKEIELNFEQGFVPRNLINSNLILLSTMEIFNVYTGEKKRLDANNYFKSRENGYFLTGRLIGENLILVFSKTVLIYDIKKCQLLKKCTYQYGSDAALINDKFYISTWDGLFLADK